MIPAEKGGNYKKEFFMRNFIKIFGIIALAAVIVFSMAACDDGGGGSGDNNYNYNNTNDNNNDNNNSDTNTNDNNNSGGNSGGSTSYGSIQIVNLQSSPGTISKVRIVDDDGKEILDQNVNIPKGDSNRFFSIPVGKVTIGVWVGPSNNLKTGTFTVTKGNVLWVGVGSGNSLVAAAN